MNKKYTAAALELAIVLLVTQIAFVCGKCAALLERRYMDCGGEYLFLLIPVIYYITKQIIADWLAEILCPGQAQELGKRGAAPAFQNGGRTGSSVRIRPRRIFAA